MSAMTPPPAPRPVVTPAELDAIEAAVRAGHRVAPETVIRLIEAVRHSRRLADHALGLARVGRVRL